MKNPVQILLLILTVLFALLCIIGAGYVLVNEGTVNAGYAVVPMSACLTCSFLPQCVSRKK